MSTSAKSSQPDEAGGPSKSLSFWSVISLVLLALPLFAPLLLLVFLQDLRAGGPAAGAVLAFLVFVCLGAAFGCALLGVITGWVGVRRSRGYPELPWASLAVHSALLVLQLILLILLPYTLGRLPGSDDGARWVVAPMIVIVGTVSAALVGAKEFLGQAKRMNDPVRSDWRLWWVWFLGLACGTGVMVCILRVVQPG
jgi:hypothetical protein